MLRNFGSSSPSGPFGGISASASSKAAAEIGTDSPEADDAAEPDDALDSDDSPDDDADEEAAIDAL